MMTSATVLQQVAECAEIQSTVRQGHLYYLIGEDWIDVTYMTLGDIVDLIS
jgi:hypothetical protein